MTSGDRRLRLHASVLAAEAAYSAVAALAVALATLLRLDDAVGQMSPGSPVSPG